jgi:hypothetical protein
MFFSLFLFETAPERSADGGMMPVKVFSLAVIFVTNIYIIAARKKRGVV